MDVWELMAVLSSHRSGTEVRIRTLSAGSQAIRVVRVEAIEGITVLVVEPEETVRADKRQACDLPQTTSDDA